MSRVKCSIKNVEPLNFEGGIQRNNNLAIDEHLFQILQTGHGIEPTVHNHDAAL